MGATEMVCGGTALGQGKVTAGELTMLCLTHQRNGQQSQGSHTGNNNNNNVGNTEQYGGEGTTQ